MYVVRKNTALQRWFLAKKKKKTVEVLVKLGKKTPPQWVLFLVILLKRSSKDNCVNCRVPLNDQEAEGMARFPVMSLLWLSHSCSSVSSERPCSLQITEIKLVLIKH